MGRTRGRRQNGARALCWLALLMGMALLGGCGKTSEDGLFRYSMSHGTLTVTDYRDDERSVVIIPMAIDGEVVSGIGDGAIPQSAVALTLPVTADAISEEAFSECPDLKYLLVGSDTELPEEMPEDCRVYYHGTSYGDLWLEYLHLDEDGVLYGLLNDGYTAVVLSVPEGVEEYEIPFGVAQSVGLSSRNMMLTSYTVSYLDGAALDDAEDLRLLTLNDNMGYPLDMVEKLRGLDDLLYTEGTLTADYVVTAYTAAEINAARSAAGISTLIEPDMQVIQAARQRMQEMREDYAGQRPDGSSTYTALDQAGVRYNLATGYSHHGADLGEMRGSMITTLVNNCADPAAAYQYDRLGISVGYGPYNAEEDYVTYAFLTNTTTTSFTYGGIDYELQNDQLIPVSCQEGYSWFMLMPSLYGKAIGAPAESFYESCASTGVRAIFLDDAYTGVAPENIPENLIAIREGDDMGDGNAVRSSYSFYVDSSTGCVYVLTDRDCYVLWHIPAEATAVEVPRYIYDYPVTYVHVNAVSGERALQQLGLPLGCGFDPGQSVSFAPFDIYVYMDEMVLTEQHYAYYSSLYYVHKLTASMAFMANNDRPTEDTPPVIPSYELMRAARQIAAEQTELTGLIRPDGSEWSTVLAQEYVTGWENAEIWLRTASSLNEDIGLDDIASEIGGLQDDGSLYNYVGAGCWFDADLILHVCVIAIDSME